MNFKNKWLATFVTAAAVTFAGASFAKTVTQPACNVLSVTTSTLCQTVLGNNDSVADLNAANALGISTWLLADKSDGASIINPIIISGYDDAKSGTWSVNTFGGYTKAALVVKGGSLAWVAYLLDITKLSGTWSTSDILNSGGKQPNLSHFSLYVSNYVAPPPVGAVPLPAAGWLMIAGLSGLATLRRKRKTI